MTARDRITSLVSFEVEQKFILVPFTYSECFQTGFSTDVEHLDFIPIGFRSTGNSSCQLNLTPANVDSPALSLISRGSLSLVLSFAFRCPK